MLVERVKAVPLEFEARVRFQPSLILRQGSKLTPIQQHGRYSVSLAVLVHELDDFSVLTDAAHPQRRTFAFVRTTTDYNAVFCFSASITLSPSSAVVALPPKSTVLVP